MITLFCENEGSFKRFEKGSKPQITIMTICARLGSINSLYFHIIGDGQPKSVGVYRAPL